MVLSLGGADHKKSVIVTGSGQQGSVINGNVFTRTTYFDQFMLFLKHSVNIFKFYRMVVNESYALRRSDIF